MHTTQHQDGYAWTWEPAAATLLATATAALLAVQTGRTLALALAGEGWHWPDPTHLVTSTGGVLTGNLTAGLDPSTTPGGSPLLAWTLSALLFTATAVLSARVLMRWGVGRRYRGMASAAQASQLLGVHRLRANRAVVRPDLYRKQPR